MTTRAQLPPSIAAVLCAIVALVLPASFPRSGGPTGFDHSVTSWVQSTFDTMNRIVLESSQIYLLFPLMLLGAAYFGFRRHSPRRVTTLLLGPILALVSTEEVLKPLYGRQLYSPYNHRTFLEYPSGSTVALVAVATAFAVVVTSAWVRVAVAALGVVCLIGLAAGLVWYDYHQPTDIIGGICWAVAVVLGVDLTFRWRSGYRGHRLTPVD